MVEMPPGLHGVGPSILDAKSANRHAESPGDHRRQGLVAPLQSLVGHHGGAREAASVVKMPNGRWHAGQVVAFAER